MNWSGQPQQDLCQLLLAYSAEPSLHDVMGSSVYSSATRCCCLLLIKVYSSSFLVYLACRTFTFWRKAQIPFLVDFKFQILHFSHISRIHNHFRSFCNCIPAICVSRICPFQVNKDLPTSQEAIPCIMQLPSNRTRFSRSCCKVHRYLVVIFGRG